MRIALKFAYDGTKFHGYARQLEVKTVEGEILRALDRIGARHLRFRCASRTDKAVSALGNVIAFDTNFRPEEICSALNANLEDIYFFGYARAPLEFNPRYAEERWYRYNLHGKHDIPLFRRIANLFVGEHDFSSFARMEEGRNPVRRVKSVSISTEGEFTAIDIRAESFLWQMVRRMVGAMLSVEKRDRTIEDIERAIKGEKIIFGIAPPEPLFLMDVRYSKIDFIPIELPETVEDMRKSALLRLKFLEYLKSEIPLRESLRPASQN